MMLGLQRASRQAVCYRRALVEAPFLILWRHYRRQLLRNQTDRGITHSWKIGQGLYATLTDRARWTKLNRHAYIGRRSMMQGCSGIRVH